jgi:sugar (glycoside-pentoside-hexuronide) transporter
MKELISAGAVQPPASGRLSRKTRFGYGIGEAGLNLLVGGISSYLLFFYTDVFGIAAGAAGLLMLIGRFWDAANDPIMGVIVDRTESRWGKFRPYILFGAGPVVVLTVLTFTTPSLGPTGKLVWAYVTFILWSMAFTAIAVPYNALLVNITTDSQERTSLSAIKTIFAVTGSLIVVVLAKPMTESLGGSLQTGYMLTFAVFGVAAFFLFMICFYSTSEKPSTVPGMVTKGLSRQRIRTLTGNRPLIVLVLFFLFFQIAFSLFRTVELYYFKYVLGRDEYFPVAMLAAHICAIIGMAVMPLLAKRLDKKWTALSGCVAGCLFLLLIYLVPESLFWTIAGICLSYLFLAIPFALFFGMVPDTVEYGQWKTGIRAAGLVFSAFTFTQKFSMAISVALASWILEAVGYIPDQIQTAFTLQGIALMRTVVPVSLIVIGMLIFLFYNLDRARHAEILQGLEVESS